MFRYERPQKGRQRQFHQLGVELLGPSAGLADAEIIALAYQTLKETGIADKCVLEINSLGDDESRKNYVTALAKFLEGRAGDLSPDSQRRLKLNPLRILDSKDEKDKVLIQNAPALNDHLNEPSKQALKDVTDGLSAMGIPFTVNSQLVRGLDYYSHCVFEFRTNHLGAQDAVLSGGRYDQLIKTMGGPATPGVGWAAGIERMVLLSSLNSPVTRPIAVIPIHDSMETEAFKIAQGLREKGFACEVHYSGNVSKRMKKAVGQNCQSAVLLGPDEFARGECAIKNLDSGEQKTVRIDQLASLF
jgi:histidyl-tRNA synthetase